MVSRIDTRRTLAPVFRLRKDLLAALIAVNETWRQRKALAELDDDRLKDLGLTRTEAKNEANRPIWDAPSTWKR